MKEELIAQIVAVPGLLRRALGGLSEDQLGTKYKNWSIRQIANHLADSHVHCYIRFKWALTEDKPLATCRELLPPERQQAAADGIAHLIAEFERIAGGMLMLNEMPPRSVDEAVAIGERLSALLIAEYLNAQGTPAEAINAAEIVVTDAVFGNASPLMEPTRAKARARLVPLLEHGVLPVVTGFNGA